MILERAACLPKEWSRPPGEGVAASSRAFASRLKGHPLACTRSCHLCVLAREGTRAPWSPPERCLGVGSVSRLPSRAAEDSRRDKAPKLSFAVALRRSVSEIPDSSIHRGQDQGCVVEVPRSTGGGLRGER